MPSSLFNCVKSEDLATLNSVAKKYGKMADLAVVKVAARVAGGQMVEPMKRMIEGESSLRDHQAVAGEITVFEDENNVVVGIPPGSPVMAQTETMHSIFQLSDVTHDLAKQAGDIEQRFLQELQKVSA
jgi:hypothetical protein